MYSLAQSDGKSAPGAGQSLEQGGLEDAQGSSGVPQTLPEKRIMFERDLSPSHPCSMLRKKVVTFAGRRAPKDPSKLKVFMAIKTAYDKLKGEHNLANPEEPFMKERDFWQKRDSLVQAVNTQPVRKRPSVGQLSGVPAT